MYKKRSGINKYQHKYQCQAKNKGVCPSYTDLLLYSVSCIYLYLSVFVSFLTTPQLLSLPSFSRWLSIVWPSRRPLPSFHRDLRNIYLQHSSSLFRVFHFSVVLFPAVFGLSMHSILRVSFLFMLRREREERKLGLGQRTNGKHLDVCARSHMLTCPEICSKTLCIWGTIYTPFGLFRFSVESEACGVLPVKKSILKPNQTFLSGVIFCPSSL